MAKQDPYRILGVSRKATQDEIKNAYRELAKKYHPDLNPGNKDAEMKFKDVSAAYEMIGTPESRSRHDRGEFEPSADAGSSRREQGPWYRQTQSDEGGGRYTYSFGGEEGLDEDLLRSIFGGRSGRGSSFRQSGQDRLYQMEVDLRDAALGSEKEIALAGGKRLAVKIPPGVTDGTRLRFPGQGDPGAGGGPSGDAFVEIHVRPDPRFRRIGDDLEYDLPVSLPMAVFGGEARVPTLEGEVMVKIPRHSNTDRRLRLTGKGVFNRTHGRRGHQFVVLKVMLPEKIDPEFEDFLRKWQKGKAA